MTRTGAQLAAACLNVATHYKTLYVLGSFGWPMNYGNQQRALGSYAFNSKPERCLAIRAASDDTFGFDCICFIKAILWGWTGDKQKEYGGAVYRSNGVEDLDEAGMLEICNGISEDFSDVQAGEYLWTDGHCGIYIGNGKAVECTYRWSDGVQVTDVYNIIGETGQKGRYWKKHGKLPYVSYETASPDFVLGMRQLSRGDKGEDVRALQILLIGRGYNCGGCGADGDFGDKTLQALQVFQRDKHLEADGVAGKMTLGCLMGVMGA